MTKRHLKTITVPVTWPIKRKVQKFTARPNPGREMRLSMPLVLVFKSMLNYCKTSKEVKTTIRDKDILIDGRKVRDLKCPIGLFDVLSIPLLDEYYRMIINQNNKLQLVPIKKEEAMLKPCKIINKKLLKKGVVQLNLSDGRNLLVKEDKYKVGDTILIELLPQKIKQSFPFEKGAYAFLTAGSHVGDHGKILSMDNKGMVTIESSESKFDTPKEFVFILGKEKPSISLK